MTNIINAVFSGNRVVYQTDQRYQYDYGQILTISGLDLPMAYEVHFSNDHYGNAAITQIGGAAGVTIPDEMFLTGEMIYAWLYLHTGTDDGETVYTIKIPVLKRAKPSNLEPTPVQQDAITEAIAALDAAVAQTGRDVAAADQSARDAAGSARNAASSESNAQASAEAAAASATNAGRSERNASQSERNASQSERNASQSEQRASNSAASAAADADRAEQAAAESGYMFFYINENGDLIYQRTPNVQVDFYLEEGDLYVEASV